MNSRLIGDHARGAALTLLDIVSPCLTTESERKEAFGLFAEAMLEILEKYHEAAEKMSRRLYGPHKDI